MSPEAQLDPKTALVLTDTSTLCFYNPTTRPEQMVPLPFLKLQHYRAAVSSTQWFWNSSESV